MTGIPKKGLLVFSSYLPYAKQGSFSICDIETEQFILPEHFVLDVNSSDNIIAYFGLCEAAIYCIKNHIVSDLFCGNHFSVRWFNSLKTNSRVTDKEFMKYLGVRENLIRASGQSYVSKIWNPNWNSYKEFLRHNKPLDSCIVNFSS